MTNWVSKAVALAIFRQFTQYGYEPFRLFLEEGHSEVTKEQLSRSLKEPTVREAAYAWLRKTKERIAQLEALMPQEPDLPPSCEHPHRCVEYTDVICQDCGVVVTREFPKG
jgi:hypothetical protein